MLPLSMPEQSREKMLDPRNSFNLIFRSSNRKHDLR